ncbi:endonuclease/exonuclease/phosphatase family protein [Jannaschia pohangensis]|nr:endonuclease/exonuclease/phosphatase family protein [Jannaschia pohangensis]
MLRDLQSGRDDQAEAALAVILAARADVILLADVDWDLDGVGLTALTDRLRDGGLDYPYRVALRPNSGLPSGVDLDGNGVAHEARDALGYGWFTGDSGLAILSRLPLDEIDDRSAVLWSSRSDAADVLPEAARAVVPLATTAQWVVPVQIGGTRLTLITMAAGTPVFDGPEDRNGLRNADELRWIAELAEDAALPLVLGRANLDPDRGEGDRAALLSLLTHPKLVDPMPESASAGRATVVWDSVGPMRVDYVLPPRGLGVVSAGVIWPDASDPLAQMVERAGPGRLVWVDVAIP